MKDITVAVSGPTGSGKTAIMAVLRRALEKENIKVTIADPALENELLETDRLRAALRSTSSRVAVTLEEVNIPIVPNSRKDAGK